VKRGSNIVIIGGGVVGASVAYHLAARGARDVLILERENRQGLGSTGKATGGVRAQFETEINIKMSLYSIDFFRNWDRVCGYDPKGYLFFTTDENKFGRLKQNVAKQKELGVNDVEIIDAESIGAIIPGMNCEDIVGGSFRSEDGFIDPLAVMEGFTKGALEEGAEIEFGIDVKAINAERGKIHSVSTNKGQIECSSVVLCAGAWARPLAATAGVDLPVEPLRRQIVWGRTKNVLPTDLPMVIDLDCGFHFRPGREFGSGCSEPDGRDVLFAFPDAEETSSFNTDFDDAFIGKVREKARHRAQFLFETEIVREKCRAGLYENTPDHHAIIGGCEVGGLYFANGFSGHGVMHSPATGRALAEIILDGEASLLDVSSLRLERFEKGEMFRESAYI
jgi:sarcosine oxidase subunit beta